MPQKAWCYLPVSPNQKAKIDREDLKRASAHKWRITKGTTGRERVVTSIRGPEGSRHLTLGRFLMKPGKGKQVYPRRFNQGLDYRKDNLIVCTLQERQQLLPKRRIESTSRYRGVSFSRASGRWKAGIEVDGRAINLGHYDSESQAALAYNAAARKHFGSNAYQNPVGRDTSKKRNE